MELRKLKVKDALTFGKIIAKLSEPDQERLIKIIEAALEKKDDENIENEVGVEIALIVFNNLMLHTLDDLTEWMADLANMKKAEFEESDLDMLIEFAEKLVAKEDLDSFFQKVSAMVSIPETN